MSKMDEYLKQKEEQIASIERIEQNGKSRYHDLSRKIQDALFNSHISTDSKNEIYDIYFTELCAKYLESNGYVEDAEKIREAQRKTHLFSNYEVSSGYTQYVENNPELNEPLDQDGFIYIAEYTRYYSEKLDAILGEDRITSIINMPSSAQLKYELEVVQSTVKAIMLNKKIDMLSIEEVEEELVKIETKSLIDRKNEIDRELEQLNQNNELVNKERVEELNGEKVQLDMEIENRTNSLFNSFKYQSPHDILKSKLNIKATIDRLETKPIRDELREEGIDYRSNEYNNVSRVISSLFELASLQKTIKQTTERLEMNSDYIKLLSYSPELLEVVAGAYPLDMVNSEIRKIENEKHDLERKLQTLNFTLTNIGEKSFFDFKGKDALLKSISYQLNIPIKNKSELEEVISDFEQQLKQDKFTKDLDAKKEERTIQESKQKIAIDKLKNTAPYDQIIPREVTSVSDIIIYVQTERTKAEMRQQGIKEQLASLDNRFRENCNFLEQSNVGIIEYNRVKQEEGKTEEEVINNELEKQRKIEIAKHTSTHPLVDKAYGDALEITQVDDKAATSEQLSQEVESHIRK